MRTISAIAILVLIQFVVEPVQAGFVLYGTDRSTNSLWTIDVNTGAATKVGSVEGVQGGGRLAGLAYDSQSDVLYATTAFSADAALYEIDRNTAAATFIAPTFPNNSSPRRVVSLAYDSRDDVLFGFTSIERLATVNRANGFVNTTDFNFELGEVNYFGLTYDPNNDVLYGATSSQDKLVVFDQTNGDITEVGPLGTPEMTGLAFDPSTNILYGTDATTNMLYTINTSTGAATSIGSLGPQVNLMYGLTFVPTPVSPVPEPASASLFALGLATLGVISRKRKAGSREPEQE